ncbi:MAG TPA: heavy metal-binding domain-containing protein [bacterium]|nr:heavy metal-binding domain-containing protein [bacterium]
MESLINLGVFVFLLALGYLAGHAAEKKHYASIIAREKETLNLPAVTIRHVEDEEMVESAWLVSGSVCVGLDYFKMVLANLRKIFGGRVGAYETLVDRARREATLRMKKQAAGADIVLNTRYETSSIGQNAGGKNAVGAVEVLAYGTAVIYKK